MRGPGTATALVIALISAIYLIKDPYSIALQLTYAALLLAVACGKSMFSSVSNRLSRVLGDASFSIYMLHGFILAALMPFLVRWFPGAITLWLAIAVGVALPLSLFSYMFIERPLIEAGKRVTRWRLAHERSLEVEAAP